MATITIPEQMRAAQIHQASPEWNIFVAEIFNQPYGLVKTEVPKIKPHELFIKVQAAGFCHSDLQVLNGEFDCKLPLIPGHEPAGVIVQIGSEVKGSWKIGDRVGALNFKNSCSECTGCQLATRRFGELDPRICENREMAGFKDDGCFAEYMAVDPSTSVLLPDSLPFEQAAPLMCAGATVWGALEKATENLEPNATVAIIGIGGLGHLGIQFAKAMGFRVIAIDSREAARTLTNEVPRGLEPDLVIDSTLGKDAIQQIMGFTDGEGVAAAVVCTDSLDVNSWTLELLRFGATMVALGLPPEKWRFDSKLMVFRELRVSGSYVASANSTRRMMRVVEKSGIRSHITTLKLEDVPRILESYKDGKFKGRLVVQIAE